MNASNGRNDYDFTPLRNIPEFIEMVETLEKEFTTVEEVETDTADGDLSMVESLG